MAIAEQPLTPGEAEGFADYTNRAMTNLGLTDTDAAPKGITYKANEEVKL